MAIKIYIAHAAILIPVALPCLAQNGTNPSLPPKNAIKRVHANLSGFELDKSKPAGTQVGGGSRGGRQSGIVLDAPRMGLAYATHPLFQWRDPQGTSPVTFHIFDASGDEIFEINLNGTSLKYPEDGPELKPGSSYSWTVQRVGESALEPPQPVAVKFLPQSEREQLAAMLSGDKSADLQSGRQRAEALVAKRIWYDAVEAYSVLIEKFPSSAELYRRRAEIYSQLPATEELAEKDFQQAEKLK